MSYFIPSDVLAQSAKCKGFAKTGHRLSSGLPQNEPCNTWCGLGGVNYFYFFAWGDCRFSRVEVGVLTTSFDKNNFTCPLPYFMNAALHDVQEGGGGENLAKDKTHVMHNLH